MDTFKAFMDGLTFKDLIIAFCVIVVIRFVADLILPGND